MTNMVCKTSQIIQRVLCETCLWKDPTETSRTLCITQYMWPVWGWAAPNHRSLFRFLRHRDTILNHRQDRQIADPVSAIMGNGLLPKTTILERRENKALRFLSSLSPAMASYPCQWNSNQPKRMWAPTHITDTCKWNGCKHTCLLMCAHTYTNPL